MRWLHAFRICVVMCALMLVTAPVVQSAMASRMEMGAAGTIPDGCKGCVGDKALAGACMTMCAMPAAVIVEALAVKPRASALFALPADDPSAGLSPLPDPPRPRLLLRA